MKPEDLKVGETYTFDLGKGIKRTITKMDSIWVFFTSTVGPVGRVWNVKRDIFADGIIDIKPLDKAFNAMGETPLVKPTCPHKNVKKESFFSARIYVTCQDCGKALN